MCMIPCSECMDYIDNHLRSYEFSKTLTSLLLKNPQVVNSHIGALFYIVVGNNRCQRVYHLAVKTATKERTKIIALRCLKSHDTSFYFLSFVGIEIEIKLIRFVFFDSFYGLSSSVLLATSRWHAVDTRKLVASPVAAQGDRSCLLGLDSLSHPFCPPIKMTIKYHIGEIYLLVNISVMLIYKLIF